MRNFAFMSFTSALLDLFYKHYLLIAFFVVVVVGVTINSINISTFIICATLYSVASDTVFLSFLFLSRFILF